METVNPDVILIIGDTKLLVNFDTAAKVVKLLWGEHIQRLHDDYKKDGHGNYQTVRSLKTMEMSKMGISYISPADILLYQAEGDRDGN